jgi:hypothetical protein
MNVLPPVALSAAAVCAHENGYYAKVHLVRSQAEQIYERWHDLKLQYCDSKSEDVSHFITPILPVTSGTAAVLTIRDFVRIIVRYIQRFAAEAVADALLGTPGEALLESTKRLIFAALVPESINIAPYRQRQRSSKSLGERE